MSAVHAVLAQTRHVDPEHRRSVDAHLKATGISTMASKEAASAVRDQTCRDPFCDAPIPPIDHITRHSDGGPTTLTNRRGVCARGNHTQEMPGWRTKPTNYPNKGEPHKIIITTPTAHHYLSRAPNPP